ncbi:MAG: MarR family transcriptional regulator [Hyphomicrobiales bacterium]|nr:MarR family transcriptional regulator [Hyphomicrobiales bacterium]
MDEDQIARVRRFNRAVSRRIGALDDRFLARGRPLGQARLLFEAGQERDGAAVRALRARLGLDAGYTSRLLRALEDQGLVTVVPDPGDRRVRRVVLTARGRREVAELDRRAEGFARGLLAALDPPRRARLVAAMDEVDRLMRAAAVRLDRVPPADPDVRHCFGCYFHELADRFDAGFDPARSISAADHELTPPAGLVVVARLDGRPLGCGALKVGRDGIGEVKRMWVDGAARGLGLGRRILARLEDLARGAGLRTLRLETNRNLTRAIALYRSSGYVEVSAFNDEPYAHHWFEKAL